MDVVLTLAADEGWCLRCGRCRTLDATGRCIDCSYMVAGREPDAIDRALGEIEAARETAAEAGLPAVYAALVKAQLVLGYLSEQLCRASDERVMSLRRAS